MNCELCNCTGLVEVNETVSKYCPNGCMNALQADYEAKFRRDHPEMSEEEITNARLGLKPVGFSQVVPNFRSARHSEDDGVVYEK